LIGRPYGSTGIGLGARLNYMGSKPMVRWMLFFILVLIGLAVGVASLLGVPLNFFNHPTTY